MENLFNLSKLFKNFNQKFRGSQPQIIIEKQVLIQVTDIITLKLMKKLKKKHKKNNKRKPLKKHLKKLMRRSLIIVLLL